MTQETTATHPPIPPNCRFFHTDLPLFVFEGGKITFHLYTQSVEKRGIIAAVAEVAWRKEADQLWLDLDVGEFTTKEDRIATFEKYSQSEDNADAWRAWGESQ